MPPLLGHPGPDSALCHFCSIIEFIGKFGQGTSLGHVSHVGLWPSAQPGPPGPSKDGLSLRGVQGSSTSQVYIENSSWPPEQLLEPPSLPTISGPQLSGALGFLCATGSLCSNSAGLLFHVLSFPFAAAFHVILLRPHSIPQSLCGSWGRLRATLGFVLREGLGFRGLSPPSRASSV